ncbi:universal stress protein [Aestuariibacter sp. GS-14]|uniref:universal stress protein n=1 Tax=Aestuariibacter sp. GS-14 TaxID=2590670 RepID=UPI0015E86897|nr:universal stress protein [Aestuariibacter sp. GS-14]
MLEKCELMSVNQLTLVYPFGEYRFTNKPHILNKLSSLKDKGCQLDHITLPLGAHKKHFSFIAEQAELRDAQLIMLTRQQEQPGSDWLNGVKSLLRSNSEWAVMLCSKRSWAGRSIGVLATIDILDDTKEHAALNTGVLDAACSLTERLAAMLHVLSVIPVSLVSTELDLVEPYERLQKHVATTHEKLVEFTSALHDGKDAILSVTAGYPPREIQSYTRQHHLNLVVLGNIARTGIRGLLLGNTAEKILEHLRTDALIVRNKHH